MGRTIYPGDRLDDAVAAPGAGHAADPPRPRARHRLLDTGPAEPTAPPSRHRLGEPDPEPVAPPSRHRLAEPEPADHEPAASPARRRRRADAGPPTAPTRRHRSVPTDPGPLTTGAHRLVDPPARRHRAAAPGRRRAHLAPVLVGLVVLGLLAAVAALRPAPAPAPADAALTGAAPAVSPAPPSTPAPPPSAPTTTASPTASATATGTPPVSASRTATRASSAPSSTASSATAAPRRGPAAGTGAVAAPSGPGKRPVRPACRGDADAPRPGDVICFTANLGAPLKISTGGTPGAPIVYSGTGNTRVPGITSTADHVVIQGFVSDGADSTGIWASGRDVVVQDNEITRVRHTDDDLDAIRFFGDGAKILHNFVHDLEANDVGGSHVDCIQTFATSRPGSSNVTIRGNRCLGIRAQCLMAEGPNAETASGKGGGGRGVSRNWIFDGNFCDSHAEAQSVALQDVQNVTLSGNVMAGAGNKAFALGQNSTGAVVKGNTIGSGYGREVGFDDDSARAGYQGPPAR